MTANLVDRYVYTALRRVPEQQRADIDRELRASIDDAVDARIEAASPARPRSREPCWNWVIPIDWRTGMPTGPTS
jgi:hypothetical protein